MSIVSTEYLKQHTRFDEGIDDETYLRQEGDNAEAFVARACQWRDKAAFKAAVSEGGELHNLYLQAVCMLTDYWITTTRSAGTMQQIHVAPLGVTALIAQMRELVHTND